jgi:hypothetical protein
MADGGDVGGGDSGDGGVKGFFKDINLLDVAIALLLLVVLFMPCNTLSI